MGKPILGLGTFDFWVKPILRLLTFGTVGLEAKLSSRDQVGCYCSLQESQGSQRTTARLAGDGNGWAPLGFLEAALAADLITATRSLPGRLR